VRVPSELDGHAKLSGCCEIDGAICWPDDGEDDNDVGWLVAGGDTMEDTIEEMKQLAGLLPDGLSVDLHPLGDLLTKIKEGEKAGVEFSDQAIPEPEAVLEK
jgi:hypothetical protein